MQALLDSLSKLSPLLPQLLALIGAIGSVCTIGAALVKGASAALGLKGGKLEHLGNLLAAGGADLGKAKDSAAKLIAKAEELQ